MKIVVYTDGASRGNPGPAGAGVALYDENGTMLKEYRRFLGETTNNRAEYEALIDGLTLASSLKPDRVELMLDSELVVRQVTGRYRVKDAGLIPLAVRARALLDSFPQHSVQHIRRELNAVADRLANEAIDRHIHA